MSATAEESAGRAGEAGKQPPRVLRGLAWLVWRQHRTAFVACLLLTAAASVNMLWQRASMNDWLRRHEVATPVPRDLLMEMQDAYGAAFQDGSWILSMVPIVAGVFLGAPLISGDRERGTVKLVTTQSVTRGRWLATKLGMAALVTVVCSALLSAVFTWWWEPAHEVVNVGEWSGGTIFDHTGPMPVAMALLHLAVGVAAGVLVRRTLPAMVLTFGFAFAMTEVWDRVRLLPFTPRVITNPVELGQPHVPRAAVAYDNWTVDANGGFHGFGTCFNERTGAACRANKGIVAERLEYFGYDQMSAMQWTCAAILLAVTAAITGLTLWWARRRPL
ncbi:ABC transporter permease subunit [Streptomyces sp. ISL-11]|uniref:ABC transporter permease n=1 Tax=Streptomyces sp. ISL-11 TaxID=2819174 RepID=UPI001BEA9D7C|nr:ABC transporter permease subunit [Streptomyces sp. ISL-11]MBT2383967.1 ABC transporter permease subunit [Streptomyces sp. ISL-11]